MKSSRPNFILIFPDQWRGDCLSCLNHPVVETPYIDELAYEGVTFTSAYSAAPMCIAARACLATGQTPSTNGRLGYQECVPWNYGTTMMKCLRDGGYQTFCTGKTHFYPQRIALGFEEMRLYEVQRHTPGPECDYHIWLSKETGGKVCDLPREGNPNGVIVRPWTYEEYLHPTNWTMDSAIELLQRRDPTRPFFIQIGFQRPHLPIDPPLFYYDMYKDRKLPPVPIGDWTAENNRPHIKVGDKIGRLPENQLDTIRRGYYAQLTHIDTQIGKLLNWLGMNRIIDDTYVIFTSDHGELLGDHNSFFKTNPLEGSAKIPMIIKPSKGDSFLKNKKDNRTVTHMDIMPTLLEAAGIDIPECVEGSSILPILQGQGVCWREYMHGEHSPNNAEGIGWQFLTDGKEKYMWDTISGREWFFNLAADPHEEHECSNDPKYIERVNLWRKRLIDILAKRPQDGLSNGERLIHGIELPQVRPELL